MYMRLFAELLGPENKPMFKGIKNASTGLRAWIPDDRVPQTERRLLLARDSASKPHRIFEELEMEMGADGIREAQLLDSSERVVFLFHGQVAANEDVDVIRVYQEGTIDGVVTGLVGADDTMHLHLRSVEGRDIKMVVRDEDLARQMLGHFRKGIVRVTAKGNWVRKEDGWFPESKCSARSFEVLDETPLSDVLRKFASVEQSGWRAMEHPEQFWRDLRGLN
ncbi:MAG: hypothetical protein IV105_17660 [Rhizobacter sp.]|nr:hypothetical protein [Rhizobacter sp.]